MEYVYLPLNMEVTFKLLPEACALLSPYMSGKRMKSRHDLLVCGRDMTSTSDLETQSTRASAQ